MPHRRTTNYTLLASTIKDHLKCHPSLELVVSDDHEAPQSCQKLWSLLYKVRARACFPLTKEDYQCLSLWEQLEPRFDGDRLLFETKALQSAKSFSIAQGLSGRGFSESIINEALRVHYHFGNVIRKKGKKNRRQQLLFQLIYYARLRLGVAIYPELIATRLGLAPTRIDQYINLWPISFMIRAPPHFRACDYITPLLEELNLSVDLQPLVVKTVLVALLRKYPLITNYYTSQVIAYACIIMFVERHGIIIQEGVQVVLANVQRVKINALLKIMRAS